MDKLAKPGKFPKAMLFRNWGALNRKALSVGRNKCLDSCLFRRREITKTWLDTVSTGATLLDPLCTVEQRPYRDGTSRLQPYQDSGGGGGCETAPN
jgi:hypothetical protein